MNRLVNRDLFIERLITAEYRASSGLGKKPIFGGSAFSFSRCSIQE
jgi:hypothetical protein